MTIKRKTMNFDKIKQEISIAFYLKSLGYKPQFENEYTARFIAPYRADTNPSLSVNISTNLFFDHGLGRGGNIIQLAALINNCSDYEAAKILIEQKNSFSFHCKPNFEKRESPIIITSVKEISNKWLIQYLHSRKIPISLARQYCKEVHYENREKQYYAIGFPNNSKGYELRNAYFKGCTNKEISTIELSESQKNDNWCLLFEGFFDFLSYLTLRNRKAPKYKTIILNSISNINKTIPILKKHDLVITYLDNDNAGKNGLEKLRNSGINIDDRSYKYASVNDLNEFLIVQSEEKNEVNK